MTLYKISTLIDDQRAKRFAALQGVNMIGSLGILLLAKQADLIESIFPYIQRLQGAGVCLSPEVIRRVLEIAKETS